MSVGASKWQMQVVPAPSFTLPGGRGAALSEGGVRRLLREGICWLIPGRPSDYAKEITMEYTKLNLKHLFYNDAMCHRTHNTLSIVMAHHVI